MARGVVGAEDGGQSKTSPSLSQIPIVSRPKVRFRLAKPAGARRDTRRKPDGRGVCQGCLRQVLPRALKAIRPRMHGILTRELPAEAPIAARAVARASRPCRSHSNTWTGRRRTGCHPDDIPLPPARRPGQELTLAARAGFRPILRINASVPDTTTSGRIARPIRGRAPRALTSRDSPESGSIPVRKLHREASSTARTAVRHPLSPPCTPVRGARTPGLSGPAGNKPHKARAPSVAGIVQPKAAVEGSHLTFAATLIVGPFVHQRCSTRSRYSRHLF